MIKYQNECVFTDETSHCTKLIELHSLAKKGHVFPSLPFPSLSFLSLPFPSLLFPFLSFFVSSLNLSLVKLESGRQNKTKANTRAKETNRLKDEQRQSAV